MWWQIILGLLKNPKNIVITVLVVLLFFSGFSFYVMKASKQHMELKYEREKIEMQKDYLKQYENMVAAVRSHQVRVEAMNKTAAQFKEQIRKLNIQGRCIKDEKFYQTADAISRAFNGGMLQKLTKTGYILSATGAPDADS